MTRYHFEAMGSTQWVIDAMYPHIKVNKGSKMPAQKGFLSAHQLQEQLKIDHVRRRTLDRYLISRELIVQIGGQNYYPEDQIDMIARIEALIPRGKGGDAASRARVRAKVGRIEGKLRIDY